MSSESGALPSAAPARRMGSGEELNKCDLLPGWMFVDCGSVVSNLCKSHSRDFVDKTITTVRVQP